MNVNIHAINLAKMQQRLRALMHQARTNNVDIHNELGGLPELHCDERTLYMIHLDMEYRAHDQVSILALLTNQDYTGAYPIEDSKETIEGEVITAAANYKYNTSPEDNLQRTEHLRHKLMTLVVKFNSHLDQIDQQIQQLSLDGLARMERALNSFTQEQEQWLKDINAMVEQ